VGTLLVKHLGDFLRHEMEKREMSNHSFADFIGVSHTTINKFVDFGERDIGFPSLEFLIKLAAGTQTDMRFLITLVVPDDVLFDAEVSPEYVHLSKQIEKLKPAYREIIRLIIDTELGKEK
jgi:plasmid maintenance system antidote protein VapI